MGMDASKKAKLRRTLFRVIAVLFVVWILFSGYIFWAMKQPPEKFGQVMMHMPVPAVFLAAPFETMWMRARAGHLQPGDPAPDFNLLGLDKSTRVQLSSLYAQKPVVLVFGSYT
jgi:hypothetical protein